MKYLIFCFIIIVTVVAYATVGPDPKLILNNLVCENVINDGCLNLTFTEEANITTFYMCGKEIVSFINIKVDMIQYATENDLIESCLTNHFGYQLSVIILIIAVIMLIFFT